MRTDQGRDMATVSGDSVFSMNEWATMLLHIGEAAHVGADFALLGEMAGSLHSLPTLEDVPVPYDDYLMMSGLVTNKPFVSSPRSLRTAKKLPLHRGCGIRKASQRRSFGRTTPGNALLGVRLEVCFFSPHTFDHSTNAHGP